MPATVLVLARFAFTTAEEPKMPRRQTNMFRTLMLIGLVSASTGAELQAVAGGIVAWGAGTFVAKPPDPNNYGQSIIPPALTNVSQIAAGWRHSLALTPEGKIQGWGDNSVGQIAFAGETNFVAIACGRLHSLAIRTNGHVVATGEDGSGQIDVPN